MCGIAGVADKGGLAVLPALRDAMIHRGPDDLGEFVDADAGVAFGMRRLSIIDLETGRQPMSNEAEDIWVICNGEIFNSPELRKNLTAKGHRFKTRNSDVEILTHLYEEKGVGLLSELNGMYAFVIYDREKRILFGARDRMGIKPLYFTQKGGRFAFASELKALLVLPWVSRDIHFESLYHYVSLQYVPAPASIFQDVCKLPAGHYFIYDLNRKQMSVEKYWSLDVHTIEERSVAEWEEWVRDKLKQAVRLWSLSDVPIACSLSGGLDSATIVAMLSEAGFGNVKTYSLGFDTPGEEEYNELPLARKVAERWGTSHVEMTLDPKCVLKDLDRMVWSLDEPYGGGLPSWYIYEWVGRDVKVCMTGTGGDELFGNYGKYQNLERWGYRFLKSLQEAVVRKSPMEILNGYRFPNGHFYPLYFSDAVKDGLFLKKDQTHLKTEEYVEQVWRSAGTTSSRNAVAFVDFALQLPEEFLAVTDRFSMAHSVEARVPFLDHTLVESVFRMPPRMRTGGDEPKSFLRGLVRNLLPPELQNAPKKGFILPLRLWTRNELRPAIEAMFSPDYLERQGIFKPSLYGRIIRPHLLQKADFTHQVWTLFMFQMWHQKFCNR